MTQRPHGITAITIALFVAFIGVIAFSFTLSPATGKKFEALDAREAFIAGNVAPDGTQLQIDLPKSLHLLNCGGSDGSGLCVFTSVNHIAFWQNITGLQDFQAWMRRFPGGGWPEKLSQMVTKHCTEQRQPVPEVIQIESRDLSILRLALRTDRMVGCTYSYSPTGRYPGRKISHMVNLVAAGVGRGPDGRGWYVVLDNNYPGSFEWMSERLFLDTYTGGTGQGWAVIFRWPGPPPVPA